MFKNMKKEQFLLEQLLVNVPGKRPSKKTRKTSTELINNVENMSCFLSAI